MLYEKKKQRPKEFVPLVILEVSLLLFIFWEFLYYYMDFPKSFWEFKFVDFANMIAQFATAGAVGLGFYQYYRNKRLERQAVLVSECKVLIVSMLAVIKEFQTGEETNFGNIKHCCGRLGGLGSDFQELFSELDESVNKGVVRMHWQSMYFGEFVHVMGKLELGAAVGRTNVHSTIYIYALAMAKKRAREAGIISALSSYSVSLDVLGSVNFNVVRDLFEFSDLYLFVIYFFESKYTNDYMYGSVSKLDIRTRAPLIAAIKNACQFDFR